MSYRDLISQKFLTAPELVTQKRYIRWTRVGIVFGTLTILVILISSIFRAVTEVDTKNYRSVSSEEIAKNGIVILNAGQFEIRKNNVSGKSVPHLAKRSVNSEISQIVLRKDQKSENFIPAGTKLEVILDGELNTQLAGGPIVTRLLKNFVFNGRVLFPENLTILGRLSEAKQEDRVSISFDRAVFADGKAVEMEALAMMPDGSAGVVGDFHSSRKYKIAGALGTSFIAGTSAGLQNQTANPFNFQQADSSTRNAILNGLAQTSLDQAKRFGEEAAQEKGYVTLDAGTKILIFVNREIEVAGK